MIKTITKWTPNDKNGHQMYKSANVGFSPAHKFCSVGSKVGSARRINLRSH